MRIRKFEPFVFTRKDEHEAWLAEMAREGWHYRGGNAFGFQTFEQGGPAEMVFSWDQAPRAKENAVAYHQQCREAGWELAETDGRWNCWSKPRAPGEPVQPLRDKAHAIAMYLDIQRQHGAQLLFTAAMFTFNSRNIFGSGWPRWLTMLVMLIMLAATAVHVRSAFYAKARVRQLEAGG